MNEPIDFQIINEDGAAKFAVVPIEQFRELLRKADTGPKIPNAVMKRLVEDVSPARAWREHLGLTQLDVAQRLGVSQAAYAQQERQDSNLRPKSLAKIASAMGIVVEQLDI